MSKVIELAEMVGHAMTRVFIRVSDASLDGYDVEHPKDLLRDALAKGQEALYVASLDRGLTFEDRAGTLVRAFDEEIAGIDQDYPRKEVRG
jgi:hypothetical protein